MENGGRSDEGASRLGREAEDMAGRVQDQLEGLRGYAEDAGDWVRAFARERPIAAIAVAVGLGFLVGRLLSRR